jgi:hypothetical protein
MPIIWGAEPVNKLRWIVSILRNWNYSSCWLSYQPVGFEVFAELSGNRRERIPALVLPRTGLSDIRRCQHGIEKLIVRIQKPLPAIRETDVEVPLKILPVESQPTFELDLQERRPVEVLSNEIRASPIAAEPDRGESVIGKDSRDLLKVESFLLAGVQVAVRYAPKHFDSFPTRQYSRNHWQGKVTLEAREGVISRMPKNETRTEAVEAVRPVPMRNAEFDLALNKVRQLVDVFHANRDRFTSADYSEAQARIDFIDKFWIALGWDVNHERQTNPYEQEVKVERGVPISGRGRRADYAFLAPNFRDVRFFVEAKRPGLGLDNQDDYFQLIRYGWNSHTELSVLTSFENFRVVDCRYRPDIDSALLHNVADLSFHYSQYPDPDIFARIFYLFSRESVAAGSLERYVQNLPKPAGKAVQRGLFPSGRLQPVDESFLQELDEFRVDLAKSFKSTNIVCFRQSCVT